MTQIISNKMSKLKIKTQEGTKTQSFHNVCEILR